MDTAPAHPRIVAITGFMGAGKSCVGRALAALLRWRLIDLDEQIERRARRSIREIFRTEGEPRFREMETQCLKEALESTRPPTVLALGGGTFNQQHNAELLRSCGAQVVFLECDVEVLLQRCHVGGPSHFALRSSPEVEASAPANSGEERTAKSEQRTREGGGNNSRPLAADPEAFRALYARRLPQYRRADLTIHTDEKTIEQVAQEIAAALDLPKPSART